MYQYDEYDRQIVRERVAQFRDQTRRYFAGQLSEEEFRPLRLQNGLYIQRHAPMLRIAVPYGLLSSTQLRRLAHVSRKYDRGYGHFTTRQNLQLNWPEVARVPDILEELAEVEMHAIQTSGNCIRNITTDPYAGIATDELIDPRPLCEILRQWSTFHPEFAYLPRKFKIAVNGAAEDRAVTYLHDIGLHLAKSAEGEIGFRVLVGGGMGRTPVIAKTIREFLPWQHILSYCDAILRVYNRYGRRDNPYKARIKILVNSVGPENFAQQVEAEWVHLKDGPSTITQAEYDRVAAHFTPPAYATLPPTDAGFKAVQRDNVPFSRWVERNVRAHRVSGYAAVTLSLKKPGIAPGDCTSDQMDFVADLADRYSFGELRVTHEQNLVLSDVAQSELFALWQQARDNGLATPTIGLITDLICCPGGDFCDLANAKSIPIADAIQQRFDDLDYQHDIGNIEINISGCMNSCGHHHVGHIGILGVDKHDEEWYQISIGGQQGNAASIGKVIGPSFAAAEVADVIEKLITFYLAQRHDEELFIDVVERLGIEPFQKAVYGERTRGTRGVAERKVANG
jgi:sulfite reductase (NADPH) hemoprotein beta-component